MAETLNRPDHPEHFDIHHENGEALVCMSSGGECRILVEVMSGYTSEEEQKLIASTTEALQTVDRFVGERAADIFMGLHIKIGEDVAETDVGADIDENRISLNGRKMLTGVSEMNNAQGAKGEDNLSGLSDEHLPGGVLGHALVREMGRIIDGQSRSSEEGYSMFSEKLAQSDRTDESHDDEIDREAFAEGFFRAVYGLPIDDTLKATILDAVDARSKVIAESHQSIVQTPELSAEQQSTATSGEEAQTNSPEEKEKEKHAKPFEVVLMRHGTPYRPGVVPDNPEDIARLGKLTEQGLKEARATAEHIAAEALNEGRPTTFFILGSPTPYFIDGEAYGVRSMETAQVARETIEDAIRDAGLAPDQADVHVFGSEVDALGSGGVGARPTEQLGEPDFYAVPKPDGTFDSRYATAVRTLAKEEGSIDKYGGPGHLEPWLRSDPSLEDLRGDVGAQSAPEVAARVMKYLAVLERYARVWQKSHPDRKMVFVLASHGEIMRTVIQHGFGAEENAEGKVYEMAEAMPITVENGKASTVFNGKPYEVSL